jgi:hypothetical protein
MQPIGKVPVGCLLFTLVSLAVAQSMGQKVLFKEDFEEPLGDRWKQVKFGELTDYRVVVENSNACLKAFAKGSASAFATRVQIAPTPDMTIRWRWKISSCPTNASDDTIATFDHTARVFAAFDTFLPPRTVQYVWVNHAKVDSTFHHPSSSRAKFIVMESGNEKAGQWLIESRDLRTDYERLFKTHSIPKIVSVGVFTDSDGTHTAVTAWYDDIVIETP